MGTREPPPGPCGPGTVQSAAGLSPQKSGCATAHGIGGHPSPPSHPPRPPAQPCPPSSRTPPCPHLSHCCTLLFPLARVPSTLRIPATIIQRFLWAATFRIKPPNHPLQEPRLTPFPDTDTETWRDKASCLGPPSCCASARRASNHCATNLPAHVHTGQCPPA